MHKGNKPEQLTIQTKNNPTSWLAPNADIEVDLLQRLHRISLRQ